MTAPDLTTPPPVYKELPRIVGFRFGDDGSVWSRRYRNPQQRLSDEWHPVRPRVMRSGHLKIRVTVDGKQITPYIHRLILEAFVGPCPPGMECCHADGNPANNRLDNLRWDTRKANRRDCIRHGTYVRARGSSHGCAKLTEADVPVIRELRREGWTWARIASRFRVSICPVRAIARGEGWKHVAIDSTTPGQGGDTFL